MSAWRPDWIVQLSNEMGFCHSRGWRLRDTREFGLEDPRLGRLSSESHCIRCPVKIGKEGYGSFPFCNACTQLTKSETPPPTLDRASSVYMAGLTIRTREEYKTMVREGKCNAFAAHPGYLAILTDGSFAQGVGESASSDRIYPTCAK
jgi:hypothetical protein